ncbi:MbnP family copper-binding protein [Sorangium sp. So ce291]|uniref:MbnP family copper-binding protein n=1 Tax=Sorangium sp. So ce291 TaxID=3133294 RepID=UPI003F635646
MVIRFTSSVSVSLLAAATLLVGCGDDEGGGGSAGATSASSSSAGSSGSSSSSAGGEGGGGGDGAGEGGSGGTGGGEDAAIALRFEGRVGEDVFSCGDTYALGTASTDVGISDFRLYIHDVRLHRAGGDDVPVTLDQDGLWQFQDLALLDFEDKTGSCANGTEPTNGEVHGTVPQGSYDGLSFKLGVPFALNHADAAVAPSPLNLSGLFWSWEAGYKFARIDTVPTEGSGPFFLHLGSTGCVADAGGAVTACDRPNVAEVVLTGFDPLTTTVLVDFAAIVAASDLSADAGGAPGCMSGADDPECGAIFQRLGIDIADGALHPEAQELFRVE